MNTILTVLAWIGVVAAGWLAASAAVLALAALAARNLNRHQAAPAGGRCPSCGEGYPRHLPADQDQRCWTCWLTDPEATR